MASFVYKLGVAALGTTVGSSLAGWTFDRWNLTRKVLNPPSRLPIHRSHLISRAMQIQNLQRESEFDVLVIDGGPAGAGCALDAVTSCLKTALVDTDGSDYKQCSIVEEVLRERDSLLESVSHLVHPLPIMLPVYEWWQMPFYWMGTKCYDLAAGYRNVKGSYFLSKQDALELFPMLKKDNLVGAVVYHDGQQDDARMCLAVVVTATRHRAMVCNHVEVLRLLKKDDGKGGYVLYGVEVIDHTTGKKLIIKAKCVVNATGSIRKMDDPTVKSICAPSSCAHIALPGYYSPEQLALLDPSTSDGRVIFFLPWQMHTNVGTIDTPHEVKDKPASCDNGIKYILNEIQDVCVNVDADVRHGDELSARSGIPPSVVYESKEDDTQLWTHSHTIHISPSNLITGTRGKCVATSRAMAERVVDTAVEVCDLKPAWSESIRNTLKTEGGQNWSPTMYRSLVQDYGLECEVAQHLNNLYGERPFEVAKMASLTGKRWPIAGNRIHPDFPCIDAEVRYGAREYACNAVDMMARRLRFSFLNVQATQETLPKICDIMAEELNWYNEEKKKQMKKAKQYLALELGEASQRNRAKHKTYMNLNEEEQEVYTKHLERLDKGEKHSRDFQQRFGDCDISDEQLDDILKDIGANVIGEKNFGDYLKIRRHC
uniref:glycerol-3-phosphate dehydrogenase n=1 Tax=Glossina morsitans morsitans TaxID=37546 RepID=A0A1B0GC41_GLOMM